MTNKTCLAKPRSRKHYAFSSRALEQSAGNHKSYDLLYLRRYLSLKKSRNTNLAMADKKYGAENVTFQTNNEMNGFRQTVALLAQKWGVGWGRVCTMLCKVKAWFSYVGKIPDDRGFYFFPTIRDFADILDMRQRSVPDFSDYELFICDRGTGA